MSRTWRILVVLLTASSMLGASTAAVVHVHEHSPLACRPDSATEAKPHKHSHSGCKHHHHRHVHKVATIEPQGASQAPAPCQHPAAPHSHDDCSLCHYLLEHSLPPELVELPLTKSVVVACVFAPRFSAVEAAVELPPARGPPSLG